MEKSISLFCRFWIDRKIASRFFYGVNGQLLIGFKTVTLHHLIPLFNSNERVGIDASGELIPVKQGGFKSISAQIDDDHVLSKLPHLAAGKVFSRVALNQGFGPKAVVELFEIDFFGVIPIGLCRFVVDFPDFGSDPISNDARIGNEHGHRVCKHARNLRSVLKFGDVLWLIVVAGDWHQQQRCHAQDAD